eukprot:158574_1
MGSLNSKKIFPSLDLTKSSISKAIQQEAMMCDEIFPSELVMECMEFIGFVIESTILTSEENNTFYEMLMQHHCDRKLLSPNSRVQYFTYFRLLYRASANNYGMHCNWKMLQNCVDISNLVMIFHTNYNRMFFIYLRNAIKQVSPTRLRSFPKDDDIGLFLLRSQFIITNTPRIVQCKPYKSVENVSFKSLLDENQKATYYLCE